MSKVIEFQLWFLRIYDASLVLISILGNMFICYAGYDYMVDLKDEILTRIDKKFNDFKIAIIAEIRHQIKQQVSEALEKEIKKMEELESTVSTLSGRCKKLSETSEWVKWQLRRIRTVWETVVY